MAGWATTGTTKASPARARRIEPARTCRRGLLMVHLTQGREARMEGAWPAWDHDTERSSGPTFPATGVKPERKRARRPDGAGCMFTYTPALVSSSSIRPGLQGSEPRRRRQSRRAEPVYAPGAAACPRVYDGWLGRRGRCLAETDLITVWPGPLGKGSFACATAAARSASTAGSFNSAGSAIRTKRCWLPLPWRIPDGSGSVAPRKKESATPRG